MLVGTGFRPYSQIGNKFSPTILRARHRSAGRTPQGHAEIFARRLESAIQGGEQGAIAQCQVKVERKPAAGSTPLAVSRKDTGSTFAAALDGARHGRAVALEIVRVECRIGFSPGYRLNFRNHLGAAHHAYAVALAHRLERRDRVAVQF